LNLTAKRAAKLKALIFPKMANRHWTFHERSLMHFLISRIAVSGVLPMSLSNDPLSNPERSPKRKKLNWKILNCRERVCPLLRNNPSMKPFSLGATETMSCIDQQLQGGMRMMSKHHAKTICYVMPHECPGENCNSVCHCLRHDLLVQPVLLRKDGRACSDSTGVRSGKRQPGQLRASPLRELRL
jgi:hypothetical protein